jgi:signal transduction histidine kinase
MALGTHFEVLAHAVEIANSSVDVGERLDSILGVIHSHFGARQSTLFIQETARGNLIKANVWPKNAATVSTPAQEFGQGKVGEAALKREPLLVRVAPPTGDQVLDSLCQPGELAALLPVMDDNRLYAVLLLIFPPPRGLADDDLRLLQMICREMAGAIRNFRLYFESKKRIAELNVLSDLGRAAVSTIEAEELLNTVVGICAKLLGARGGLITVMGRNGESKVLQAVFGQVPPECIGETSCLSACWAKLEQARTGPSAVCETGPLGAGFKQGICAPLAFKGRFDGHLCVFDKMLREEGREPGFNPDDRNLLATMASMVAPALENAFTFQRVEDLAQRNEEMVGALATLFEVSTVLMTTVDFNLAVQIILESVVHPTGLDHDRVVLFLSDEQQKTLRPVAEMDKASLSGQQQELTRTLNELRERPQGPPSLKDPNLASLVVTIDPEQRLLSTTVLERKPGVADNPGSDPRVRAEVLKALGPHPFVTVPMFAKNKVVGVLVVNNYLSGRPFGERDLKLLGMLANLGGLAVEASRLYHNLEKANRELAQMRNRLLEADKLAALGEVAAGVAHEIRNPLVSIGGFTRRIRKKVGEESNITPYLDVIIDEVGRLERTLNEMLDFSTDARNQFEEYDLNLIMDQALELLTRELEESRVKITRRYGKELPRVFCDDRQIKHVFLNIYLNALQAMAGRDDKEMVLRTFAVMREGKQFVAGEVSDTGGGIAMEVIHNIFNPFFTTKDSGSGLGLSIVHKIVTRHFGQVEVHNREGEGASFLVTLPAAEEGRAYLK